MDAGVSVLAAAPGRVVDLRDGEFDRNMSSKDPSSGKWNFVTIEHSNGFQSTYGHLKKGSIKVSIGQEVVAGQELGSVGSSGKSGTPHLHFELEDEDGQIIDPFLAELWEPAPFYEHPMKIMDYSVNARKLETTDDIKDPLPNITSITPGSILGVGMSITGIQTGDEVRVYLRNGGTIHRKSRSFNRPRGLRVRGWNFEVEKTFGTWIVLIYLNDEKEPAVRHEVRVVD